jgi:hypothetical protein
MFGHTAVRRIPVSHSSPAAATATNKDHAETLAALNKAACARRGSITVTQWSGVDVTFPSTTVAQSANRAGRARLSERCSTIGALPLCVIGADLARGANAWTSPAGCGA